MAEEKDILVANDTSLAEDTTEKKKKAIHSAKEYLPQGIAAFGVIAAAILLYFVMSRVDAIGKFVGKAVDALAPVIWGFVFAFLLSPLVRFLEKKVYRLISKRARAKGKMTVEQEKQIRKKAKNISIFLSLLSILFVVILLILAIVPELITSIEALVNKLPTYANVALDTINKFLSKNKKLEEILMPYVHNAAGYLETWLSDKLSAIVSTAYTWVTTGMRTVITGVFNLIMGVVVCAYLLGGKDYYLGLCKKVTFAIFRKDHAKTFVQTMHKANIIYSSAILGKIIDSILIGLICFIGSTIMGLFFDTIGEYAILVSIVVGVTNIIPFFGPFIGGIPCTVLIMCMNPLHALIFAAFLVVLQQFDCNYLEPHVVGKSIGLRPLFVLVACLFMGGIGGIVGMLLASPTFALVYSILKAYFEVRLERKNLPKDTESYVETPGAVIARRAGEGKEEGKTQQQQ